MTDPRIQAAQQAIEGADAVGYTYVERRRLVVSVLPAALRLLEAVEEYVGYLNQDRHGDGAMHINDLSAAAAEFLALLPAVEGEE